MLSFSLAQFLTRERHDYGVSCNQRHAGAADRTSNQWESYEPPSSRRYVFLLPDLLRSIQTTNVRARWHVDTREGSRRPLHRHRITESSWPILPDSISVEELLILEVESSTGKDRPKVGALLPRDSATGVPSAATALHR